MSFRWTHIRTVDQAVGQDRTVHQPFSLWWAALAAADETLQGGPLAPAWLRLFSNHLSTSNAVKLRWAGDLAESAELRRAYSSLYGRYFARALLSSRLGFTDFISLKTNKTTLPRAATITRVAKGDIPDWIAWDPSQGIYVLGEAKGSLTGNEQDFLSGQPACVKDGKKQFSRVKVADVRGRKLATRNWVAANLWSTDRRNRESVSLLWDPPTEGFKLPDGERALHADSIRRRHVANLAMRLGRRSLLSAARKITGPILRIVAEPRESAMPTRTMVDNEDPFLRPIEKNATEAHEGLYAAALISPMGIRPISGPNDIQMLEELQRRPAEEISSMMLFGVSVESLIYSGEEQTTWLSGNGIASPEGTSLFELSSVAFSDT